MTGQEPTLHAFAVMEHGHEHGDLIGVYTRQELAELVAEGNDWWHVKMVTLDTIPDAAAKRAMQEIERLRKLVPDA